MSYNIPTSSSPQFSPVTDLPAIGDWVFNQPLNIVEYYTPGTSFPSPISIDFTVPDVLTAYEDSTAFDHFLVRWAWNTLEGPAIWRSLSTDIDDGVAGTTSQEITTTLDFNITLSFQNLDWIVPSAEDNYRVSGNIRLQVIGVRANVSLRLLYEEVFNIKLYYILPNTINLVPDSLVFNHIAGNALPAGKTLTIYHAQECVIWLTDNRFEATGAGTATEVGTTGTYTYTIVSPASNVSTIAIVPKAGIEDIQDEVVTIEDAVVGFVVDENNSPIYDQTSISFFTSSDGSSSVSPQQLTFFSIIGVEDAAPQSIEVISPHNSSISAPPWLLLSADTLSGVGSIEVIPMAAANFLPGIYTDVITITIDGVDFEVNVQLEVVQNIQLNLSQTGFNFTDDNQAFTQIFTPDDSNQLQLEVTIPQIGYPTTFQEDQTFNYLTGFLNNRTKIHVGEIVRRALYKITKADFVSIFQSFIAGNFPALQMFEFYSAPNISLQLSVVDDTGVAQSTQESFSNIQFILGRPPIVSNGFAFLQAKPVTQRVFKNSVASVNYLAKASVLFNIVKNNVLLSSHIHSFSGLKTRGFLKAFKNYEPGDVIKITASYLTLFSGVISNIEAEEKYIVYPEGKHLNTIAYADEYGCVSLYDFSGDWNIESEYQFTESTRYQNLVEFFRNENTDKVQGITLNTGFIPKDNAYFIDLIIRSGMAWLTTNGTEDVVELVPQTKKLTNTDSDQELYAYDVTFKINRTHDFQDYS